MNAIKYVVAALPELSLCLQAANALRDLCDANRSELAPHIGAFAELHARLTDVPVRSFIFLYIYLVTIGASTGRRENEGSAINCQCNPRIIARATDIAC
jgi:hypothetical protein